MSSNELVNLLDEATNALACLDATGLAAIERRAFKLQVLLGARVASSPEIAARYRVFAGVLRATEENLAILNRVSSAPSHARTPWDR